MAERNFSVVLSARVDAYVAAMQKAADASGLPAEKLKNLEKVGGQMQAVGKKLTTWVTLPIVGAGAAAIKAAVDWESAWAGVTKTVDGTDAQLATLQQSLRDMAKELPASHSEIAAVAEAAGQLGVSVGDVEAFTRVMIDMGESTNLSAEEAAVTLARFMNIMGSAPDSVSNIGSAIVGLGNNFAATEAEIAAMAMRLAGSGRQMGLTEGDVLGLAAAMADVGIEAEAGGTAMSLTMKRIATEVETNGPKLEMFARVAGMSASEFSQAWRNDAAGALIQFIAGLSSTEAMGMSTIGVLKELGITGVRESDALLRLSGAHEKLASAVEMGNGEYERGTALSEEAGKRYETMASRMGMVRNQLVDLFIDLGEMLMPFVEKGVEALSSLVGMFQALPAPVQGAIMAIAGLAAAVGPLLIVGGTLIKNWLLISSVMKGVPAMLGPVGLAIAGVAAVATAAYYAFGTETSRAIDFFDGSTDSLWKNTVALLADATAASGAAREVEGAALAHQALAASLAEAASPTTRQAATNLNVSYSELLDTMLELKDETLDDIMAGPTRSAKLLAGALQVTEQEAAGMIGMFTSLVGQGVDIVSAQNQVADAFGVSREAFQVTTVSLMHLRGASGSVQAEIESLSLAALASAVGLDGASKAAVEQAEALHGSRFEAGNAARVMEEYTRIVSAMTPETRAAAGITDEMVATLGGITPEAIEAQLGLKGLSDAWDEYAKRSGAAMTGMDYAKAAVDRLRQAFADVHGPMDNMRSATIGIHEEWDNLEKLMRKNPAKLNELRNDFDLTTEKGVAWSKQITANRDAIIEYGIAQLGMGKSMEDVTASIAWNTQGLYDHLMAVYDDEDAVADLIDTYGLTPDQITTALKLEGERSARETIDRYIGVMDDIPDDVRTEIEAAFREGDLNFVNRTIDAWATGATLPLRVQLVIPASQRTALKAAASLLPGAVGLLLNAAANIGHDQGAYIRRGHIAQLHDDEVVLPLSKPGRMSELLGMPQVGPRVAAAMGSGNGGTTTTVTYDLGGVHVTTSDQAQIARETRREIDASLWQAKHGVVRR